MTLPMFFQCLLRQGGVVTTDATVIYSRLVFNHMVTVKLDVFVDIEFGSGRINVIGQRIVFVFLRPQALFTTCLAGTIRNGTFFLFRILVWYLIQFSFRTRRKGGFLAGESTCVLFMESIFGFWEVRWTNTLQAIFPQIGALVGRNYAFSGERIERFQISTIDCTSWIAQNVRSFAWMKRIP